MQFPAQIQATIELLSESIETQYPADRLMANYFRARRYIGSKDKAAISEYFYQVLRNRLGLEYLLEGQQLAVTPARLLAALLHLEGQQLANIFTSQRHQPTRLASSELERLRQIDKKQLQTAPEHVQLNIPDWLEPHLRASLGGDFINEITAANQRASTDIRVNTLKINRSSLNQLLGEMGYRAEECRYSPWGLRFSSRVALFNSKSFQQGMFEIQDEGSQLLAWVSNVQAGQKVVDFCAGAGGKTLAMAAMMNNKGVIYACDVHSKRLQETLRRAKRAGVHNIRTHCLSSEHDKWVKQHREISDVVLIDAPCSGTGTWRRSPDSRWNLTAERLEKLQVLQRSILQSAARLVKPGGRLLYATCSLLRAENEEQVSAFLSENPHFSELAFANIDELFSGQPAVASQLRLLTSIHQTDGFFIAQLQRTDA